nr:Chain P, GLY-ASP-GLU-GLU-ALA-GLY-GLU [Homo sapiens]
GDEEAGE